MTNKITLFLFLVFSLIFVGNVSCIEKATNDYHRLVFENKTTLKKYVFYKNDNIVFKEYSGRARNGKILDFDGKFITIELGFGKLYNYFLGKKVVIIRYEEVKTISNKEHGAYWFFTNWRGALMFLFTIISIGVNFFYLLSLSIAISTETVRHPFQKFNILVEY